MNNGVVSLGIVLTTLWMWRYGRFANFYSAWIGQAYISSIYGANKIRGFGGI
jgi:hypothetical protein